MLDVLMYPFLACLVITALHCYMGLHVVKRGVIFVDLALAQTAALGGVLALLLMPILGMEAPDHDAVAVRSFAGFLQAHFPYILTLAFAFLAAALFALSRFRDERVPHEAIIGIVYVVSAALAVLILSKAPHGHEKMEEMLVGNILFANGSDVLKIFLLYFVLGVVHFFFRKKFFAISDDVKRAEQAGMSVRWWDFLFYASFGLMVTQSVGIAGVLVVFSFLIIPNVCALMFFRRFIYQLLFGWGVSFIAIVAGLWFSTTGQEGYPVGPSLVGVFGLILVLCVFARLGFAKLGWLK
ncbi:MAG: metal ABC transporter permease [Planctomycetes bacterium]|nr:metal ABC transporter permease [Planctomycetota bacterium]